MRVFVMMEGGWEKKQTNRIRGMKWWKYVQNLITEDNCFRVRGEGEGSEVEHVREGKKNLRISSLCLWPAPDSGAKLSLRRRSTPSSTFHLSSLGEHAKH